MSWSVSASGRRAEVKAAVEAQLNFRNYSDPAMKVEVERARVGLQSLLDSTESTHASVSAAGSLRGSVSVSISAWDTQDVLANDEGPATAG